MGWVSIDNFWIAANRRMTPIVRDHVAFRDVDTMKVTCDLAEGLRDGKLVIIRILPDDTVEMDLVEV